MKVRDALKLRVLIGLYAIFRTLALVFESRAARAAWRCALPTAASAFLIFGVLQLPCEHDAPSVLPSKPTPTAETVESDLPFYEFMNPVRKIGDTFGYARHAGYQVPFEFNLGLMGPIHHAELVLTAQVRTRGTQYRGTEAIWVDGVLSGTPFRGFVNPANIAHDVTATNRTFFEAVDTCCRRQIGETTLDVDELLQGSGLSAADVLEDGRLKLVIGDDTEVLAARLIACDARGYCREGMPSDGSPRFRTLHPVGFDTPFDSSVGILRPRR